MIYSAPLSCIVRGGSKEVRNGEGKIREIFREEEKHDIRASEIQLTKARRGETIDEFILDLHRLADHCAYGVLREEMIRDRIQTCQHTRFGRVTHDFGLLSRSHEHSYSSHDRLK